MSDDIENNQIDTIKLLIANLLEDQKDSFNDTISDVEYAIENLLNEVRELQKMQGHIFSDHLLGILNLEDITTAKLVQLFKNQNIEDILLDVNIKNIDKLCAKLDGYKIGIRYIIYCIGKPKHSKLRLGEYCTSGTSKRTAIKEFSEVCIDFPDHSFKLVREIELKKYIPHAILNNGGDNK